MKRLLLALILTPALFGAIAADAVWQVQTVSSSDANGGCWDVGNKGATGTDMSQGAATTITGTLSAVGTTALADSGSDFTNTMLGNCINISGQGVYVIVGFTNSAAVTVDRTLGTFSTTTGVVGGPIKSLGYVCSLATAGNTMFFKNDGTFSITSATNNVTNGTCNNATSAIYIGYTSNRTAYNTDAAPTIQTNVSTATMWSGNQAGAAYNFVFDGNNQTASKFAAGGLFINVTIKNFNTASTGNENVYNVLITGNSATVVLGSSGSCIYCEAYANTATPMNVSFCVYCLSYSNTGGTTDGISTSQAQPTFCVHCTAYANGRYGITNTAGSPTVVADVYSEGNTSTGYNMAGGATITKFFLGYGAYNNSAATGGNAAIVGTTAIVPSSTAFVSSTNLALNATANAGALLRNASIPATFLRGLTSTYLDIGAVRHQDPPSSTTIGTASVQ